MKTLVCAALLAITTPSLAATYAVPGATVGSAPLQNCVSGYICLPDDTPYTFTIGSLSYPPPFLQSASASVLAAMGVLAVVMTAPPGGVSVQGSNIQLVNGVPTQVWQTSPYTAAQQAALSFSAQLTQGVAVTCATSATVCTSSITGTYALDAEARANIAAERLSLIADGGVFLSGTMTESWLDTSGTPHTFTAAQFAPFATAAGGYYRTLVMLQAQQAAGQSVTWPSNTIQLP